MSGLSSRLYVSARTYPIGLVPSSGMISLPSRQRALPVGVDVTAHFGFVVAFAVGEFGITLAAAGELVVIELDAQAGLGKDADAAF